MWTNKIIFLTFLTAFYATSSYTWINIAALQ